MSQQSNQVYMGWEGTLYFLSTDDGYSAELAAAIEELTRQKYTFHPIRFGEKIARIQNVSFTINRDLRRYYEIGDVCPVEIRSGNFAFNGSFRRGLVNGALLRFLIGASSATADLVRETSSIVPGDTPRDAPSFNIAMQWNNSGTEGVDMMVVVVGAKLANWSPTIAQADFVLENVTFQAKGFKVFEQGWIAP